MNQALLSYIGAWQSGHCRLQSCQTSSGRRHKKIKIKKNGNYIFFQSRHKPKLKNVKTVLSMPWSTGLCTLVTGFFVGRGKIRMARNKKTNKKTSKFFNLSFYIFSVEDIFPEKTVHRKLTFHRIR